MGKKKPHHRSSVWTPFEPATPHRNGQAVDLGPGESVWRNSLYTVVKTLLDGTPDGAIHLSVRHNQRKAIRDWRHFQRIKNELAGPEREGVELFPPESKLVDMANQYHIWVMPEGKTTPFTWQEGRFVADTVEDAQQLIAQHGYDPTDGAGAVQRPQEVQ